MTIRRCAKTVLIAPTLLAAAACGDGGGGGGGSVGRPDACALVTAADLGAHFDTAFDAPMTREAGGGEGEGAMSSCSYGSDDGVFVTLMAWSWPNVAAAEGYIAAFRDTPLGDAVGVSRLGDEALRLVGDAGGLHVREGRTTLTLSVSGRAVAEDDAETIESALARKALGRL